MSRFIFSYAGTDLLMNDESELDDGQFSSIPTVIKTDGKLRTVEEKIVRNLDRATNIIEQTDIKIALSHEIVKRAYHLNSRAWKLKKRIEPLTAVSMNLIQNNDK